MPDGSTKIAVLTGGIIAGFIWIDPDVIDAESGAREITDKIIAARITARDLVINTLIGIPLFLMDLCPTIRT